MPKIIPIEDMKVGMMFTQPLYVDNNNVLIPANVALKEADFKRLIRWGIKELYTDGEIVEPGNSKTDNSEIDIEISDENFDDLTKPQYINSYNRCLVLYKDFIDSLNKHQTFDRDIMERITEDLLKIISTNKNDIISYMAIENDDYDYLITHGLNSTIIALIGGLQLDLTERELMSLGVAGLLHDIGMLKIPDEILKKTEKLTEDEYTNIKSHPIIGYKEMNKTNIFSQEELDAVLQHHEQFDGNGYPRKLKGEKVSLLAKILAIADSFEAQISPRIYRKTKTGYLAMKSVLAEAQNKFDPKVLRAFLTTLSIYPPGTLVQLNNNSIAAVISINPDAPLRPRIKIIIDEFGEKLQENLIFDLKEKIDIFIVRVLNKEEYNNTNILSSE